MHIQINSNLKKKSQKDRRKTINKTKKCFLLNFLQIFYKNLKIMLTLNILIISQRTNRNTI
jgi:hypothetical protein